jgi:Skp family chaperone for outer membrane proteins
MKKLLTSASILVTLLASNISVAQTATAPALPVAPARIVLVSMEQLYTGSIAGKAAFGDLDGRITGLNTEAQTQGKALKAEEEALVKQRDVIDAAAFEQRVKAYQDKGQRLQADFARREQEIRSMRAHVAQQLNTAINPIIKEEMEARSANIALDPSAALLVAPSIDITSVIMTKLNARFPRASVTPMPQARTAVPAPAPATPPKK